MFNVIRFKSIILITIDTVIEYMNKLDLGCQKSVCKVSDLYLESPLNQQQTTQKKSGETISHKIVEKLENIGEEDKRERRNNTSDADDFHAIVNNRKKSITTRGLSRSNGAPLTRDIDSGNDSETILDEYMDEEIDSTMDLTKDYIFSGDDNKTCVDYGCVDEDDSMMMT